MSTDPAGSALINPGNERFFIFESNNWYSYCANNPVNYMDPTGKFLDTIIDIGCILYDVVSLGYHAVKGDKVGMLLDAGALAADAACLFIPFGTGGGAAVRVTAGGIELAAKEGAECAVKAGVKTVQGIYQMSSSDDGCNSGRSDGEGGSGKSSGGERKGLNLNKVKDKYLKEKGIDAHEIKKDILGKKAPISQYDLYVNKGTNELYLLRKGGKGNPIPTGIFLK